MQPIDNLARAGVSGAKIRTVSLDKLDHSIAHFTIDGARYTAMFVGSTRWIDDVGTGRLFYYNDGWDSRITHIARVICAINDANAQLFPPPTAQPVYDTTDYVGNDDIWTAD